MPDFLPAPGYLDDLASVSMGIAAVACLTASTGWTGPTPGPRKQMTCALQRS
ncbi:MAG: DUF1232 domain-containing protein [Burkholderiales bacterium]|nr:DUF1232 domain-containing protein [Burkholderiales bacterium]